MESGNFISDVLKIMLSEKDYSKKYYFNCLCFKWGENGEIVVCAKEWESYRVKKYQLQLVSSLDELSEIIENDYCIPICFGFGFIE